MCRIFGHLGNRSASNQVLDLVSGAQISGGPDQQDYMLHDCWSLGSNRLAIQGLDGGEQPYYFGKVYAAFNGEIYNHVKLRNDLVAKGYKFRDTCDGSIIPALYTEYGRNFIRKLDGMFAIAVIDSTDPSDEKLFLYSDSTGIKSVYYSVSKESNTLAFASEIRALQAYGLTSDNICDLAVNDYLAGKSLWGGQTIFEDMRQLEPGKILFFSVSDGLHLASYDENNDEDRCFMQPSGLHDAGIALDEALNSEIRQMLCADVPVCVVTSGGLDSSYITALAAQHTEDLHSFNVSYAGNWPLDERHHAETVSKKYKTIHHQVEIQESEFIPLLADVVRHLGQPNSAPHCLSTYALFKAVKEQGFKTALTGEGADEMFGGYNRFQSATYNQSPDWFSEYSDKLSAIPKEARWDLYSERYKERLYYSDKHHETMRAVTAKLAKDLGRLDALLHFDQIHRFPYYILRRVDHLSMANSVEVRVPFCQKKIQSFSRKLHRDFKIDHIRVKKILYEAAKKRLPSSILNRPKQPFTLPITAMLRGDHPLFLLAKETLGSQTLYARGLFDRDRLLQLVNRQSTKPNDADAQAIWALTVFELWIRDHQPNYKI